MEELLRLPISTSSLNSTFGCVIAHTRKHQILILITQPRYHKYVHAFCLFYIRLYQVFFFQNFGHNHSSRLYLSLVLLRIPSSLSPHATCLNHGFPMTSCALETDRPSKRMLKTKAKKKFPYHQSGALPILRLPLDTPVLCHFKAAAAVCSQNINTKLRDHPDYHPTRTGIWLLKTSLTNEPLDDSVINVDGMSQYKPREHMRL